MINTVDAPRLLIIYETIFYKIIEYEIQDWTNIYQVILQKVNSANTFNEFHGSCIALRQIVKLFHLSIGKERNCLEEIIQSCFPLI